jgi:hypothetical protein
MVPAVPSEYVPVVALRIPFSWLDVAVFLLKHHIIN